MNRQFFAGVVAIIVATVCISVPECSGWAPPLYIDSDWKVYAPVGQTAIIDAWVESGGPVYSWVWSWGGYQDQYDEEYSSMSWGHYDSSGVYSAYVDASSAGGSDDAHSYVYAVAVTQVISSTSATCVGQNVTFGAITNPPNCAPYVSVTWSGTDGKSGSGSQFTTSWSTGGLKTVTATCGDSSAQKQVTIVQVVGVSATADAACVGQNAHFAAVTEPPNSAQLVTVTWSGGQNPATGSGSQWTTNWSSPGPKTVIATCGSSSAEKDLWIFTIKSETVSDFPANTNRTTLGLGEEVICATDPPISVDWWISGGGTVSPAYGAMTTFTAMKSVSYSTVIASAGTGYCTLDFTVIAPDSKSASKYADVGLGFEGPPNNSIGAYTIYDVTVNPTTVSFYRAAFRENIPEHNWTWPDGTPGGKSPYTKEWGVDFDNTGWDNISDGPDPISRIYNGANYVDFNYSISWVQEYKNEVGQWIEWFSSDLTNTEYRGSDQKCRETFNGIPGDWQGPWQ